MHRDELIDAATQAMVESGMNYGRPVDQRMAEVAIEAVEPLIRADERDKFMDEVTADQASRALLAEAQADTLADLRAKIEAVDPIEWALAGQDAGRMMLALFDGNDDD